MKKLTQIRRLSFAMALAVGLHAVQAGAAGHTNAVQTINLQLTLLTQGPSTTNGSTITATTIKTAVATKDVIGWLGTATTNHFPATAKLVRVKHFNAGANTTTIEVRFGTNSVNVSQFFDNTVSSEKIDESTYNTVTKLSAGNVLENLVLVFTNAPNYNLVPHFRAGGSATVSYVSVKSGKTTLIADQVSATTLAGAGASTNGTLGLVTGSVTINGTVTEVK